MSDPGHENSKDGNAGLLCGFFGDRADVTSMVTGFVLGILLLAFFVVLAMAIGLRLMPYWSGPGM